MSTIKHSCPECNSELEFPEQVERVCCPSCGQISLVEIFENLVTLKRVKEDSQERGFFAEVNPNKDLRLTLGESLQLVDKQIVNLNRELHQRRLSAFSSLSVSALFFFFALFFLAFERQLFSLCFMFISTVMVLIAGSSLRDSARSRSSLVILIEQREQILKELNPYIPRIF
ncbi:MAG: hypothetical protein JNN15_17620 [Blastocatellia bacterium]|nr:hypothetical protein [Blastocatellia bacterium]